MANRFAIQRDDGFTVAHFGLISRSGLLLDRFACVFPEVTLELQKEKLVQYSDRIGLPKSEMPDWVPQSENEFVQIPVVTFVHLTSWDRQGEICLWNYSQGYASHLASSGSKELLSTWGVALIQCGIDLQRAFLRDLYEAVE